MAQKRKMKSNSSIFFTMTFLHAKCGTFKVILYEKSIKFSYKIKIVAVFKTYCYWNRNK